MPDYDLNRMQADAVRRAREMQSRARATRQSPQQRAQSEPPEVKPTAQPTAKPTAQPAQEAQPVPQAPPISQPTAQPSQPPASLLDNLFQDRERTIILALLILLSGENANHELLFALMFLLM